MTMAIPVETALITTANAPAYETTLADLGDRLSWLTGLVEEIQEQANAGAAGNARITEIAHMMAESMSEAAALHLSLQTQLQSLKK